MSVPALVDHLFRHEAARMTATLARILGPARIDLIEDVVQEALLTALGRWPHDGVPANPTAWLVQVAKRRALDVLRREQLVDDRETQIRDEIARWGNAESPEISDDSAILDDQLRMIFICCHPEIPAEARVTLTLKLAGGFGAREIARAFLAEETAIHQRLVRAKRRIRDGGLAFEMPETTQLAERLDSVLEVLYAMFTEGHTAHAGDALLRRDICEEAMRLGALLLRHPAVAAPEVHALMALFHLQAARFDTRAGDDGELLLLADQDRLQWDREHIAAGLRHLERSAAGTRKTRYHLEAELAACHTLSPSWEATNWRRIVELYEQLLEAMDSPIVALNRAIAVAEVSGPMAGLTELKHLEGQSVLRRYPPYDAAVGEMLRRLGRYQEAGAHFARAAERVGSAPVRRFLERRLRECAAASTAVAVENGEIRPSSA
jgi:RNA polymerase sigma-70 factor (ECF subfamily)